MKPQRIGCRLDSVPTLGARSRSLDRIQKAKMLFHIMASLERKRKTREDDDEEGKMSDHVVVEPDHTFENSFTQQRKAVHRDKHTDRDFFTATLEWAELSSHVATESWAQGNEEFMCCKEHMRLTDNFCSSSGRGCPQCDYVVVGKPVSLIDDNRAYHVNRYPMLVEYKPNDASGRATIRQRWVDTFHRVKELQDALDANEGDVTQDMVKALYARGGENLTATVAYKQYAWQVADSIREEWRAAGLMTGEHNASRVAQEPPAADTREGFLEQFADDMLEVHTRGSSTQMWCMQHNCLGDWTLAGNSPSRYLDCGFCTVAAGESQSELDNQRRQALRR